MRHLALLLPAALACAKTSTSPAPATLDGRWVMENTAIAYHLWGDSAEAVMYPPQAPAPPKWRVQGDTVLVTEGSDVSRHAYTIRGDSLFIMWNPGPRPTRLIRIWSAAGSGLVGSWRNRTQRDVMVVTFRSDSVLIGEIGVQPWPQRRGDTLVTDIGSSSMRLVLRRDGRGLHARAVNAPQLPPRKLVRRPWGCFGIELLDGAARECR